MIYLRKFKFLGVDIICGLRLCHALGEQINITGHPMIYTRGGYVGAKMLTRDIHSADASHFCFGAGFEAAVMAIFL